MAIILMLPFHLLQPKKIEIKLYSCLDWGNVFLFQYVCFHCSIFSNNRGTFFFPEPAMFTGHTSNIRGTFYLDGDKKIASASDDKTVRYST